MYGNVNARCTSSKVGCRISPIFRFYNRFKLLLDCFLFRLCFKYFGVWVCFFSILPFFAVLCSVCALFVFQSDHDKSGEVAPFVLTAVSSHIALEFLDIAVTVLIVNSQILALDLLAAQLDSYSLLRLDLLAVLSERDIYGHHFIDVLVFRDEIRNDFLSFVCGHLVNVKFDALRKCSFRCRYLNVNIAGRILQVYSRIS